MPAGCRLPHRLVERIRLHHGMCDECGVVYWPPLVREGTLPTMIARVVALGGKSRHRQPTPRGRAGARLDLAKLAAYPTHFCSRRVYGILSLVPSESNLSGPVPSPKDL